MRHPRRLLLGIQGLSQNSRSPTEALGNDEMVKTDDIRLIMSSNKKIREKLSLASAALLQIGNVAAADKPLDEWDVDTAVLFYSESDGRVSAIEPVISGTREYEDGDIVNLKLVLDTLTGATPNGAHESTVAQTFTNPSGKKEYIVPAGELPLDDTFLDTRVAFSGSYQSAVLDNYSRIILGGNVSKEFDYTSLGVSANFLRDYNNRNTTFSASIGLNADSISPSGGVPTPFANMKVAGTGTNRDGADESKNITDIMLGVTQVINRKTIMQFNLGFSDSSGYMNDPYKIIGVVDSVTGLPITPVSADDLPYLYENRPDSRSRQTFFWKTVHHLTEDVINVSYRYHTDDWGIDSHTIDFHYRYELNNGSYLQPHLRYYTQSAADFYVLDLLDGQPLPEFASADYRLAEFVTNTIGLKYAVPVGKDSEFSVRAEVISQVQSEDLAPDTDAFIIQFGYDFYFGG